MCGHVGIAGKLEFSDEALMKRLLVFDYFRGPDSTGMAVLRNNGETKIAKMAVGPIDLFDTKTFSDALSGTTSQVFLGHNRLATKGIVNNVNAHPYQYGNIIGAHNGTLDVSSWKDLEKALGKEFAVDSQAVICAIDELGIRETVKLLRGAWALVWINLKDEELDGKPSINFLRNDQRPLFYSFTEKFDKIVWASEWQISHAAMGLATVPLKLHKDGDNISYWQFAKDMWYRFNLEELRKGSTDLPTPHREVLKGKEPYAAVSYQCGSGNFTGNQTKKAYGGTSGTFKGVEVTKLNLQGSPSDPTGGWVTDTALSTLIKHGCQWCGETILPSQFRGVEIFENTSAVLCGSCTGHGDRVTVNTTRSLVQ